MDKQGRYQKSASGRRVRLIPAAPRQDSSSDSQSGSPKAVMRKMPYPFTYQPTSTKNEEMPNSPDGLNDIAHLSDTQAVYFTSSSSHDLIAGTGSARAKGVMINRERSVRMEQMSPRQTEDMVDIVVVDSEEDDERTHVEIASEMITEILNRKRKGKAVEIASGRKRSTK